MTDVGPTTETPPPADTQQPSPPSVVAPSGGAGQGPEAEQEAGTRAAEVNADRQDELIERRKAESLNAREIASQRAAIGETKLAEAAEKIRSVVKDLPPPGPGLPQVDPAVIAATMDPNNPILNPDMSELGRTRGLPPGARVPEPVLPQDTIQTQFASKPPTDAHGEEGMEVSKGLPEPLYPPAGSQPTIELTEEEQKALEDKRDEQPADTTTTQPTPESDPPQPGQNV